VPEGVRLSSFAGCFDKELGVEYQDCYFTTPRLSQPVLDWLNDTVQGTNLRRNLNVVIVNFTGSVVSHIEITNGFLSDFSVTDFDASSLLSGSLSFVVVPDSLQRLPGGSAGTANTAPLIRRNAFALEVAGTSLLATAGVGGIHLSVPKIAAPNGALPRHRFVPGAPQYDGLQIELTGTGSQAAAADAQYLDTWAAAVAQGQIDLRDAHLSLLSPTLSVVGVMHFTNLTPLSALEPFPSGNRRSITLQEEQFVFVP